MSTHVADEGDARGNGPSGAVQWRTLAGIGGTVLLLLGSAWMTSIADDVRKLSDGASNYGQRVAAMEASQKAVEQRLARIEEKLDRALSK